MQIVRLPLHKGLGIDTETSDLHKLKYTFDVLIIDKVSMTPSQILSTISRLKRAIGIQVICVGDWNQRDSIENKPEADIEARRDSVLYRDICDYQVLELDDNLRNDDTIRNTQKLIINTDCPKPYLLIKDFIDSHLYTPSMTGIYRGITVDNYSRLVWTKKFNSLWVRDMLPTLSSDQTLPFEFIDYTAWNIMIKLA
eukprot:Lithocolla_globosa_v1_NODE_1748_length_2363_cov_40.608319.p2 type:complete len:197 gc:universal NODE_1748_length_2363_cov_40.608319:152-742(+)